MFAAAAQGYGAEPFDGLQEPDGSEAFLNNAELADGFQTSASSADGAALDEEDLESMSDGAGMSNEQYGKARQQAKKVSGVSNTKFCHKLYFWTNTFVALKSLFIDV